MHIICKLANLHIHKYVKYSNSVVKYQKATWYIYHCFNGASIHGNNIITIKILYGKTAMMAILSRLVIYLYMI